MEPLLTIATASARLAISRASFYRLIKNGDIKVVRIGRSTRVAPSELERLIRDKTRGGN